MTDRPDDLTQPIPTDPPDEQPAVDVPAVDAAAPAVDAGAPAADTATPAWATAAHGERAHRRRCNAGFLRWTLVVGCAPGAGRH